MTLHIYLSQTQINPYIASEVQIGSVDWTNISLLWQIHFDIWQN